MSAMRAVLILIALRYFFYAPGLLSDALLKHSLFLYPPYAWHLRSPSRHSGALWYSYAPLPHPLYVLPHDLERIV